MGFFFLLCCLSSIPSATHQPTYLLINNYTYLCTFIQQPNPQTGPHEPSLNQSHVLRIAASPSRATAAFVAPFLGPLPQPMPPTAGRRKHSYCSFCSSPPAPAADPPPAVGEKRRHERSASLQSRRSPRAAVQERSIATVRCSGE